MIGIYGVNGFIGRHLLARLIARKAPARAVSRHLGSDLLQQYPLGVDFIEADLRDPLEMSSSLQGIETVVQLISTSSPGLQNRYNVSDIQDNVIPHVEFIQSAIASGVKKYVFISSGGTVYGPGVRTPIPEDAPTNPISSHGLTKLMIEKYLQMHGYVDGLSYVILRVANPFGPGQAFRKGQGLIPALMARYAEHKPVRIIGDGSARRDFIFIDDLIDAIEAAVLRDDVDRAIINIGSGESRSVLDVVETIEEIAGIHLQREHVGQRNTDVDINVLNIARANEMLGWAPKTNFRSGLEKTLRAYSTGTFFK